MSKNVQGVIRGEASASLGLKGTHMTEAMNHGLKISLQENVEIRGTSFDAKDEASSRSLDYLIFFNLRMTE